MLPYREGQSLGHINICIKNQIKKILTNYFDSYTKTPSSIENYWINKPWCNEEKQAHIK